MNEINGWTMRDEFAKAAMHGVICNDIAENMMPQQIAAESYDFADAMLEARKPKESPKEVPKEMSAKLALMLEQYRHSNRGLPTYAELLDLVQP